MAQDKWKEVCATLEYFGHPQHSLPPVIHITGTNGKGSVAAFLTAIFRNAGYRVHRLTSPHLWDMTERILVNNQPIARPWLNNLMEEIAHASPTLAFPHIMTIAAIRAFTVVPADIAVIEVGIGGRLDSTNVVSTTCMSVITPISLDHQETLGPLLSDIAREKSGIMRPHIPCVVSQQPDQAQSTITRCATERNTPLWLWGRDWAMLPQGQGMHLWDREGWLWQTPSISLQGEHQLLNAATAVMAAHHQKALPLADQQLHDGVVTAVWPGRLQCLAKEEKELLGISVSHDVWLDGAHNAGGFTALAHWINQKGWGCDKNTLPPLYVVVGMRQGKDSLEFWQKVAVLASNVWVLESWGNDRGLSLQDHLALDYRGPLSVIRAFHQWKEVIVAMNQQGPARWILCGSLYFIGFVLEQCRRRKA